MQPCRRRRAPAASPPCAASCGRHPWFGTRLRRSGPLAQRCLGLGDHVAAIVECLDILHRDWAGEIALVGFVDGNRDVAHADLGVYGDGLLEGDWAFHTGLEDPYLTEGRPLP